MKETAKVVVLDDDPTGTQTVHGVAVLTAWNPDVLATELQSDLPGFFILTNTRALSEEDACARNREIGTNLMRARELTGQPFVVVSRSDSTLRGHFPAEVETLAASLGLCHAPILLCPYFEAGGRVTIGDVHLLRSGEREVPVGNTEFARDARFGFSSSNLKQWVEEKTQGRIAASSVESISLAEIRSGMETVVQRLLALPPSSVCVLNCELPGDVITLAQAGRLAEALGKDLLYRTAAGFAGARLGIAPRSLLTAADLSLPTAPAPGGLVVVGSYVGKSTEQLHGLLGSGEIVPVEVSVRLLLDLEREAEIDRAARAADAALSQGQNVAIYTSREHVRAGHLDTGGRISQALVEIVRRLQTAPRYLLAKGGITSSDLATDALGMKRAMVLGQIAPGVPVWRAGPESRWPGLPYLVFPGNVGSAEALMDLCHLLRQQTGLPTG